MYPTLKLEGGSLCASDVAPISQEKRDKGIEKKCILGRNLFKILSFYEHKT